MKHVAPHRWADAFAGRVDTDERATMDAHADRCRSCAKARERIKLASGSFPALRSLPVPEIAWDSVRARVHWSVSSERRLSARKPTRHTLRWVLGSLGVAAAAAITLVMSGALSSRESATDTDTAPIAAASQPMTPVVVDKPAALTGLVSRAAGDIQLDGQRVAELFDREIAAGTKLTTSDGRVDVQFGDATAFTLGPRSQLELRRFDAKAVELAVDGALDVQVSARAADQTFVVAAGSYTVEVRGTQFRVGHDEHLTEVACKHGLVVVRDRAGGSISVSAGRKLVLRDHASVAGAVAVAMSADELIAMTPPIAMPVWTSELGKSSAPLEVTTSGHKDVRVDGLEIGQAPLRVRVMAGRHTVEAEDSAGRFRPAGWVDVGAKPARVDVPADAVPTAGIATRKHQLAASLDRAHLASCTRRIAKAGISDAFVDFSISVDATGAVGFLNIINSDLPSQTQECVKAVLQDVRFAPGATATWRDRLNL